MWVAVLLLGGTGIIAAPATERSRQYDSPAATAPDYEITKFSPAEFDRWTIYDADADGNTWQYYYETIRTVCGPDGSDDWAFTPDLALKPGFRYQLAYTVSGAWNCTRQSIEVTTGNATVPSAHTLVISAVNDIAGSAAITRTANFVVPDSEHFYIGFHANVPVNDKHITLKSLSVKEIGSGDVPGNITGLSVQYGANGTLEATLAFKAPVTTLNGKELTELTGINIFRDEEPTPVKTFVNPLPGADLNWTDTSVDAGLHTYKIIASNSIGTGDEIAATVFVGPDTPEPVADLTAEIINDRVVLNWKASVKGANNGYIDPAAVTYQITRIKEGNAEIIEDNVAGTGYMDESLDPATQFTLYYQIVPVFGEEYGAVTSTREFTYGSAYLLPFIESFASSAFTNTGWRQETTNERLIWKAVEKDTWSTDDDKDVTVNAQDDDGGLIMINSYSFSGSAKLISPSLDISGSANPRLTFRIYHSSANEGRKDSVKVGILVDGQEYKEIPGAGYIRYRDTPEWVEYELALAAYKRSERVSIVFNGLSKGGNNMYIDNIRIENGTEFDMEAVALTGPGRLMSNDRGTYTFKYKNNGGTTVTGYTIQLYVDDVPYQTLQGETIDPAMTRSAVFTFTPDVENVGNTHTIYAKIVYDQDLIPGNDVSEEITTLITPPLLPAVSDLKVTSSGNTITLTWEMPDYIDAETLRFTDDMESYEAFIYEDFGGYTMADLDNCKTHGLTGAGSYPNIFEKMAYQVFDPTQTLVDKEELYLLEAHSGKQFLASFMAYSTLGNKAKDDWLITPPLSGNEQAVSFYAKALNTDYPEYFLAAYSKTTADPDDFIKISDGTYLTAQSDWTKYTYVLPEGSRYFAIRTISPDGYMFMVDDITFERAVPDPNEIGLQGYNIHRDGVKLNNTPVTERTYTDELEANGTYIYTVSAVYESGESLLSKEKRVKLTTVGIENTGTPQIRIWSSGRSICISGAHNTPVRIFTTTGIAVTEEVIDSKKEFRMPAPGIYLVKTGHKVKAVTVR